MKVSTLIKRLQKLEQQEWEALIHTPDEEDYINDKFGESSLQKEIKKLFWLESMERKIFKGKKESDNRIL